MNKQLNFCIRAVLIFMIWTVLACGKEEPPASQPQAVSKKITTPEQPKPVTTPEQPKSVAEQPASPDESPSDEEKTASELIKSSLEIASMYNPKGKVDPFEPLFKDEPQAPVMESVVGKRKRRTPQTPLERVALSQIKLSAIMRSSGGNRALVEDATGKGYVIKKGTYIGLNAGLVIQIAKDRVVIEEEVENLMGELIVQNTELKLQKPAGEM
jgi:type IV pilus assembly protein PilP